MLVTVVGSGKLATELIECLDAPDGMTLEPWRDAGTPAGIAFVLHAGSGRQLPQVVAYCERTGATLLELSTGSILEQASPGFPVVLCPNTNILMLKFMSMLAASGHLFRGYEISLQESHQHGKTSAPGTALALAQSLGLKPDSIASERDPSRQMDMLAVPREHLVRHAVHRIRISDGLCTVNLESRVMGSAPYARGVGQLLRALRSRPLDRRLYRVEELISAGWI
jgi:4-hydroxy-tetrahydrodipicolinate reductase